MCSYEQLTMTFYYEIHTGSVHMTLINKARDMPTCNDSLS